MQAATTLFLAPVVWLRHRSEPLAAWRVRKRHAAVTGLGSMGGYLIILFAMQLTNVSYVVALREVSVVIGAVIGWRVFREPVTAQKIAGVLLVCASIVFLRFA